jgi:hypothetical protein
MAGVDAKMIFDLSALRRLKNAIPYVSLITQDALDEYAHKVFDASQNLVPVQTGNLRQSGEIVSSDETRLDLNTNTPAVEIAYTADYALTIHEDLTLNHPNGGQAKYLEQPMMEFRGRLLENIQKRVSDLLDGI